MSSKHPFTPHYTVKSNPSRPVIKINLKTPTYVVKSAPQKKRENNKLSTTKKGGRKYSTRNRKNKTARKYRSGRNTTKKNKRSKIR